jgi:ArsR family transcriptional regulator
MVTALPLTSLQPLQPPTAGEACCAPLTQEAISVEQAAVLATRIKALAEPARLRLVSLLAASPGGEACVCDLTGPLGLSQPTVSHHLKVLHQAGLLTREKRATWAYYAVVPEALGAIADVLTPTGRPAAS